MYCAIKPRLRTLIQHAYEKIFICLLTAGASSALTGSHYADRCDLFLGFVNGVARLHGQQLHRTAALQFIGIHGLHGLAVRFNGVHQWAYQGHNMLQGLMGSKCRSTELVAIHGLQGLIMIMLFNTVHQRAHQLACKHMYNLLHGLDGFAIQPH